MVHRVLAEDIADTTEARSTCAVVRLVSGQACTARAAECSDTHYFVTEGCVEFELEGRKNLVLAGYSFDTVPGESVRYLNPGKVTAELVVMSSYREQECARGVAGVDLDIYCRA